MSEPDPPETTAEVEPTLARTGFDPKASFEGAHLTLRADRAFDLVDLTLDGVQAAPEWRSPKEGPSPVITVGLPPWVFDARPHRIDATVLAESLELDSPEERRTLSLAHQSDYDGEIQELHPARIRGWIRDRARPRAEIDLEIVLEPGGVKRVRADERLYDSAVTAQSEPRFRIDAPLPDAPHPPSRIVRVKLAGADHYPLPALIIGDGVATATAALNAQVLGAPAPGPVERYWAARTAGPALLKAVRDGEAVRLDVSELGEEPTPAPDYDRGRYGKRRTPIRVVIPAYKDLDVTRACLKSVAEARVRTPFAVTVIDDAGPEPGFGKGLRTTAAALGFDYQRNTVNLGFVRTANLGFGLDDEADVVLLNSDTRVYDGWLDRLHAAAYSADDIATVTPFSNNATICSLPDMRSRGGAVFGFDYAGLNAIAGEVNAGVTVDLPTGVGFCLYMRRVALREVGVFDAERFGRGYGEENDFCLRAMARGWRNVAACDVVVAHVGGRSFGADGARLRKTNTAALEALYPDYTPSIARFVARDPLARARNRLLKEVWRRRSAARDQGGIIVLLAPGLGGGATHHADDLARRLIAEGRITLIARRVADAKGGGFTISDPTNDDHLYYPEADGFEGFAADVLDLADILHVHGLIDLDVNILGVLERTDRAIFVTLHDYFYLCPRVTLLDATGQYCGLPPVRRCELCVQTGGVHNGLDPSFKPQAMRVEGWRDRWRAILEKADTVFAPSQDVADRYRSIWPDVEITVRPHWWPGPIADRPIRFEPAKTDAEGHTRVVLLGGLAEHKGFHHLNAVIHEGWRSEAPVRFVFIGPMSIGARLERFPNVELRGPFDRDSVIGALRNADGAMIYFPGVLPETYSYTLSEALRAGLWPVLADIGAPAERVRALGVGEVFDREAGPRTIFEAFQTAAARRSTPEIAPSAIDGNYPVMTRDYFDGRLDITPAAEIEGPYVVGHPSGVDADGWCAPRARLGVFARNSLAALHLTFYVPAWVPSQYCDVSVNGARANRRVLAADGLSKIRLPITEPSGGLLDLSLGFGFEETLPFPDQRRRCAQLIKLDVVTEAGAVVEVFARA